MKTFETEKHSIPEGATHYRNEDKDSLFTWLKVDDDIELWCDILMRWRGVGSHVNRIMSQIVPIPQTNIETPEKKEALDLIDTTPHQYEMSKFSGNEWNGEGLPPVGVECEYKDGDNWYEVKVKYLSEWFIVIEALKSQSKWIDIKGTEISFDHSRFDDLKFRKPETPQQREERERANAIYDMCASADNFTEQSNFWAGKFYDLGYRKESN